MTDQLTLAIELPSQVETLDLTTLLDLVDEPFVRDFRRARDIGVLMRHGNRFYDDLGYLADWSGRDIETVKVGDAL